MSGTSLREKTVKGVGWTSIDSFASYGITFIVGLVLARLLTPEDYGLIGIITIFITIFNTIVDSGFSIALIRKSEVSEDDYSTVFYLNLVISLFLAAVLFFGAPLIAVFFNRQELVSITQVMSLVVIINALSIVQKARLTKQLDFKTQTKVSIISSVSSGVIGITLAFCGAGVWALVFQQISRQFFNTVLLWIFNRWIPRLKFSVKSFKELFSFSWKLLVAQIISTLWHEMYQLVIGKCYVPSTLGHYTRAKQFGIVFSSNITSIVQRVSLPVMSEVQNEPDRLIQVYRQIIKTTMFITCILMMGLAAIAEPMIVTLIGKQWLPCVPFLQIICFELMFYPLHALNLNLLQIQGRSDLMLILQIVKNAVALIPLALGIFVGIYWMLIGSVLTGFVDFFLNSYFSGKLYHYTSFKQLSDVLPSIGVSLFIALPVWLVSLLNYQSLILLVLQLLLGTILFFGISEYFKQEEYITLKSIVKKYTSKVKF